jgi:hypothetical protein
MKNWYNHFYCSLRSLAKELWNKLMNSRNRDNDDDLFNNPYIIF